MDGNLPGSSVHEISQARILDWVAISFSRGSSWLRDQNHISFIVDRFFTTEPLGSPYIILQLKKQKCHQTAFMPQRNHPWKEKLINVPNTMIILF